MTGRANKKTVASASGASVSRASSAAKRTLPNAKAKPSEEKAGFLRADPNRSKAGDEIAGWVLIILALFFILGIYLDVLGPTGRFLRQYGALAFGWGADILPVSMLASGITLTAKKPRRGLAGIFFSLFFLWIAGDGLAAIAAGSPRLSVAAPHLGGAGGYVGSALAVGAASLIGTAGAAVVFALVFFLSAAGSVSMQARSVSKGFGKRFFGVIKGAKSSLSLREPSEKPSGEEDAEAYLRDPVLPGPTPDTAAVSKSAPRVFLGAFDDDLSGGVSDGSSSVQDFPAEETALPAPAGEDRDFPSAAFPGGKEPFLSAEAKPSAEAEHGEQLSLLSFAKKQTLWRLPKLKLLKMGDKQDIDRQAIRSRGLALEAALASHGVETHLTGFTAGPTVTRYELELGAGVKVARVTSLAKDIAYAMASPDVRILAPIPGKSAIGVEVPNEDRHLVTLGEVLSSPEAKRSTHPLDVALGRDIAGRAVMVNLAQMPHLLIAGATGAGKSSCINSLLTSILMRSTPDQVRLILVDPKRVELGQYNGLPHLLTPVVVNPKKAANALNWAVAEMERRYDLLAEAGVRDITGYNQAILEGTLFKYDAGAERMDAIVAKFIPGEADEPETVFSPGKEYGAPLSDSKDGNPVFAQSGRDFGESDNSFPEPLPYVLVVVDELNDLMMVAARDVEDSICRIAQMARAVGIHLVIATQRPSVDVITGVIKANIPSRLAFSVSSLADSRVILDQPGAERLIGRGDLLLLSATSSVPRRIQGPWVSEEEVREAVKFWLNQSEPKYQEGIQGEEGALPSDDLDSVAGTDDELLEKAMELVVQAQMGSTSMLQRKLRVGFARAGRLMDLLEQKGVVGPAEGSKARSVLMSREEFEEMKSRVR